MYYTIQMCKIKIKKNFFYIFILLVILFFVFVYYKKNSYEPFENSYYAFVINLEKRTDRLAEIQTNFKDAPFQLVRFNAVKIDPPQQGCAQSFVNLVRMAKEKGLPTVLVFEDDNVPEPNSFENWSIIKKYLDNTMDKWEIFNGGLHGLQSIHNLVSLDNNISLIKTSGGYLTNWIYINSSAYDKILQWEEKNKPLIDLWFMNSFNIWCCYPLLGVQKNDYSDIDKSIKNTPSEIVNQKIQYERQLSSWRGSDTN